MRYCKQCQAQMEEGFSIKVNGYGVPKIVGGAGKPIQVAVCPACGEVLLYLTQRPK